MKNRISLSAMFFAFAALALPVLISPALADEGMWLMNQLPGKQLQAKYGFAPTDEWARHVQRSCLRFGYGGSASFVSGDGLIMTNHHVGSDDVLSVSTAEHDYMQDGFYAPTRDKEIRCPDAELFVLMEIRDVTDEVREAVKEGMSPSDANTARNAAIARIEKQAKDSTSLHPEMVTLYGGARFNLYLYKTYNDVRLVFCPEQDIAFFGGDIENFEYPRFDLDITFFRVYEDGKPLNSEHHFRWSKNGTADGDLVFMAGHPYRTERLFTLDHLAFLRDVRIANLLHILNQREVALHQFMAQGPEYDRIAKQDLLGVQNSRKAYDGILSGLLDERIMGVKAQRDRSLRDFVSADPRRSKEFGSAWEEIAAALSPAREAIPGYLTVEYRRNYFGQLFYIARHLVRNAAESQKPDADRLEGYHDVEQDQLQQRLFSPSPIYPELEVMRLTESMTSMARLLGGQHPAVAAALAGKAPLARAEELVAGTRLTDIDVRKELYGGGMSAIEASGDPMIRMAAALDPFARKFRDAIENDLKGVERDAYAKIAQAMFEQQGADVYPDATGSLRLSVGTVKGYEEKGKSIPPFTNMGGAFELASNHNNQPPYNLPSSWHKSKGDIALDTPFNFVSTNDIIGGNSGSPAFNKDREIVGIVFDGNIQGLIWDIQFDQEVARSVSVDSRAIIESLKRVYHADALVAELIGK